jgi:hypothetical protein
VGGGFLFSVAASSVFGEATGFLFSYHPPLVAAVAPVRLLDLFVFPTPSRLNVVIRCQPSCPSAGCVLTITGSNFGLTPIMEMNETFAMYNRTVMVGSQPCLPSAWTDTEIVCAVGPGIAAVRRSLCIACAIGLLTLTVG